MGYQSRTNSTIFRGFVNDFNKSHTVIIYHTVFFRRNVFEPYERARRDGQKNRSPRSLTLIFDFSKFLPKMEGKTLNYFPAV